MEETSVGIAASAVVASLAEWVDLDGCLLLADDPFEGLELGADHRWRLADAPGLGLSAPARLNRFTRGPHGRSAERPFVWITWWTKSWTSPLPASAGPRVLRWSSTAGRTSPRGGAGVAPGSPRARSGIESRPADAGGPMVQFARGRPQVGVSDAPCDGEERHAIDGSAQRRHGAADPEAVEFIRFCYRRRRVGWPELYDEMCAVAGRGLFRGYDADDLAGIGIGFSLFEHAGARGPRARVVARSRRSDAR